MKRSIKYTNKSSKERACLISCHKGMFFPRFVDLAPTSRKWSWLEEEVEMDQMPWPKFPAPGDKDAMEEEEEMGDLSSLESVAK
jgi:hypothetical protein